MYPFIEVLFMALAFFCKTGVLLFNLKYPPKVHVLKGLIASLKALGKSLDH